MKPSFGFLLSALAVAFLAGCGSSGGSSTSNSSTSNKCSNPNPTIPSIQTALSDIFPSSLLSESYQFTGMSMGYLPVGDIVSYKSEVTANGFSPFQDEVDYVSYLYSNTYSNPNIPHTEIFIFDDGYVDWYLAGSAVEVHEADFDSNI
ncbi:MAG: hypothetical protein LBS73_04930, partial [Campylobacteraceae bacterium]|nr:hypothetical protein [Campylobacteraceae bacterium]